MESPDVVNLRPGTYASETSYLVFAVKLPSDPSYPALFSQKETYSDSLP